MALGDHMHTDITEGATQPFARRGACPTLSRPMQTGDGLLARLRPKAGILDINQFESLARAAAQYGNGLLEITSRGSLQIRGLRQETIDPLATAIDAAGIVVLPSPVIELPPLHRAGFGDVADAAAMELQLREQLADLLRSPGLAPKLAIIIDGGGRFGLADVTADIRLLAVSSRTWQVAIAGDGQSARPIAIGTAEETILAVSELLRLLLSSGWRKRCREIPHARLQEVFPSLGSASLAGQPAGEAARLGVHESADGTFVVGLRPRFGQMSANDLLNFLASVRALGVKEIRPAPDRCFFLTGLLPDRAPIVLQHAHRHGLSSDSQDMCMRRVELICDEDDGGGGDRYLSRPA
jgi:precorrin-3B synthase